MFCCFMYFLSYFVRVINTRRNEKENWIRAEKLIPERLKVVLSKFLQEASKLSGTTPIGMPLGYLGIVIV